MRHEENYLGSNSRMSTSAGSAVGGSTARYTPFGDWRTEPTATLTNRGYTGHLHNNLGSGSDDLGLIYMNARYYLPYIADIIQAVKSGSEFWDSAFKNGAVMFLTLAGADVIADGAETIICAIKGQLGCVFTSGLATFIPGVSGGMVKEGLQSTANRLIPQYRFLVQRFDVKELRTMVNVYFGKDYMEFSEGGTMEFVNELLLYVEKNGLQEHLRDSVIKFLEDHRYDPTVIEEFKNLFE